jgi:superfamily II DNA or RNA helicase
MSYPKIIDNKRKVFIDVINDLLPKYDTLSIATGYWDIEGMKLIIDQLGAYKKIRILIGREPLLKRDNVEGKQGPEPDYPDNDFFSDLQGIAPSPELGQVVVSIKELIDKGILEVRVYRRTFLHAKCYVFGDYGSDTAIGVIGSSNFTRNGMTTNTELNALDSDHRVVTFEPKNDTQEVGHLFWFNDMWNDEKTEEWTGQFLELVRTSPHGDLLNSPRDMYLRTLYELYRHEIEQDEEEIINPTSKTLFDFQQKNVKNLRRILDTYGVAMLADSVGLGKTISAIGVIKQYKNQRVVVIAPKSLTGQWEQELAKEGLHNVRIISLQNTQGIAEQRAIDKYSPPALFVIDESHNLRSHNGTRYELISDWISDKYNEESHVLLCTATPINNSLTDLTSQILLGARGDQDIFTLAVKKSEGQVVTRSFYEAIDNIRKRIQQDIAQGGENLEVIYQEARITLEPIIRNFVVRNTRQSIGSLTLSDGTIQKFPDVKIKNTQYQPIDADIVISKKHQKITKYSIDQLADTMDRLVHPLRQIDNFIDAGNVPKRTSSIYKVYQLILGLSFVPYRWSMYDFKLYEKTKDELRSMRLSGSELMRINMQLSLYGIMRTLFLKRLESSAHALEVSLNRYLGRIHMFEQILRDENIIINLSEIDDILDEYSPDDGDQISYSPEELLEKARVHSSEVDANFNKEILLEDIQIEKDLIQEIIQLVQVIKASDPKMQDLKNKLKYSYKENKDKKILIFTFFADTIDHIEESLKNDPEMAEIYKQSAFVSGRDRNHALHCADRFAPEAKGAQELMQVEGEITYLFATDVLSEGQNLQDCGEIINYDLHWNPVRMVQRNGRINRLGTKHDLVTVDNFVPSDDLEKFLGIVDRLNKKIELIRHAIGNDSSIFGEITDGRSYTDLYSDDSGKATEAYEQLETSLDAFSDDLFLKDLKGFLKSATDEEIRQMKRIPYGSWGIVPHSLTKPNDVVLFSNLVFSTGSHKQVFFGNDKDANGIEVIQHIVALQMIRSMIAKKQLDTIVLSKNQQIETMVRRGPQIARDSVLLGNLSPTKEVVLNESRNYGWSAEEVDKLRATLSTRNVNLGRKVNRIVRSINSGLKDNVSVGLYYDDLKKLLVEPTEPPKIVDTQFLFGYTDCFSR